MGHFFPEEFYRGASLLHLYYSFRHHTTLLNEKLLPEKNATECSFECVCVCVGEGGRGGGPKCYLGYAQMNVDFDSRGASLCSGGGEQKSDF